MKNTFEWLYIVVLVQLFLTYTTKHELVWFSTRVLEAHKVEKLPCVITTFLTFLISDRLDETGALVEVSGDFFLMVC